MEGDLSPDIAAIFSLAYSRSLRAVLSLAVCSSAYRRNKAAVSLKFHSLRTQAAMTPDSNSHGKKANMSMIPPTCPT